MTTKQERLDKALYDNNQLRISNNNLLAQLEASNTALRRIEKAFQLTAVDRDSYAKLYFELLGHVNN